MINLATPHGIGLFALIWGLVLLAAYFVLPGWLSRAGGANSSRRAAVVIIIVALFVRCVPNIALPVGASYDVESYRLVADVLLSGEDVYTAPQTEQRHPYLPFQMYWMAAARWTADTTNWSYVRVVRKAPILADLAICLLIFGRLRHMIGYDTAFRGALLYALNPVSVFVSAYHGQFDAIPLLFLVLAIVTQARSLTTSAVAIGLGILSKSWPVLGLPSLVWHIRSARRRVAFLLIVGLIPILGIVAYVALVGARLLSPLGRAVGYNWGVGVWGYTFLLRLVAIAFPDVNAPFQFALRYGRYITLAVLALVWLLRAREERPLCSSILTVFVAFFAFTHAFSIQYLVWLLPLAILCEDYQWLNRYTLAATSYMMLVYSTLILASHITNLLPWPQADWFIIMPSALPAWLVALGWAVARLRGLHSVPEEALVPGTDRI